MVVFIIKGFNIRGKLRNSIFGNILIALHKKKIIDFEIGKSSFYYQGFNFINRVPVSLIINTTLILKKILPAGPAVSIIRGGV